MRSGSLTASCCALLLLPGPPPQTQFLRAKYDIPDHYCVAAGDSGNDILMLGGEHPAIVVGNAQVSARRPARPPAPPSGPRSVRPPAPSLPGTPPPHCTLAARASAAGE